DAGGPRTLDNTQISWSEGLEKSWRRGERLDLDQVDRLYATYRPFDTRYVGMGAQVNERQYKLREFFPRQGFENYGFWAVGTGSAVPFSVIASRQVTDAHIAGAGSGGNFFGRYTWRHLEENELSLYSRQDFAKDFSREDNITDAIHKIV